MRDLSKRCNKTLIRDYLSNPNQTMEQLAIKYGYTSGQACSYQITKYLKLNIKNRKLALKQY
jgi:hypothetical protein